jgi:phosphinothricin acetyltransferase
VLLDRNVVGWCSLSPAYSKSAYRFATTPAIYLDKPAQHKGLGRPLLNFLEEEAKRLGYHAVVSDICTENEAVLRMLAHMGWRRIGVLREVGYKFDRWLDVAIYQKILT